MEPSENILMVPKIMVSGSDALRTLEYLCSAKIDRPVGNCIYSLMLNRRGGVEADLVVTRKSRDTFYLTVGSATTRYVIRDANSMVFSPFFRANIMGLFSGQFVELLILYIVCRFRKLGLLFWRF